MTKENQIISYIRQHQPKDPSVVLGIGDDAAVLRSLKGNVEWVVASDVVIEGTHFKRSQGLPSEWGKKSINVNLSDFAAMGAIPRYAVLGLGFPENIEWRIVKKILDGIQNACHCHKVVIIGGDTVRSEQIVISVTMIGEVSRQKAITRSGARPGDILFLTGPLGNSYKTKHHLNFIPKIAESTYLRQNYKVHAMIDVSDGLVKDLSTMMGDSQLGATVRLSAVPFRKGALLENVLYDGEDFELLFALSPSDAVKLLSRKRDKKDSFEFYPIGMTNAKSKKIDWLMGEKKIRVKNPKDHHFNSRTNPRSR